MATKLLITLICVSITSAQAQFWQSYIISPSTTIISPKSIVSTTGTVENPEALLKDGDNQTVLIRNEGDEIPSVILDFGQIVVGYTIIKFNGSSTNTPGIRLAFSETRQYLGDVSDYSRSNMPGTPISITPGSDQIAVASEAYTWNDTWGCQNGTQVCSDGLHGFRYLKIYLDALESDSPFTSSIGWVNIEQVSLQFTAFLGTADTFQGWFECSDRQLTHFWYAGVYTNDLTTDIFRETDVDPRQAWNNGLDNKLVLHDGAKRDRDPYIGDVAVSGRTAYLSHGNLTSTAARNVLADLADNQRQDGYIPSASVMNYSLLLFDYPLWWVVAANDYVLHTGDVPFLEKYFINLKRVFEDYYPANTNNNGLISKPGGYGDYAFVGRDGEASYYNALYVYALQKAAQCAGWLNEQQIAEQWLERASTVSKAFETFWDDSVGAYKNSNSSTSHPQDANSIAILAKIADNERATRIINHLTNATARPYGNAFMDDDSLVGGGSQRVYAFMSNFEISARFQLNDAASALDEIRRLYGWMDQHDPGNAYWEGVGPDGSMYQGGFTSAAHGWSTGVVGLLTNYVLGLQITAPGGDEFNFKAVAGDVEWAQGQIMTTHGPLIGRWGAIPDNSSSIMSISLEIPEGTRGAAQVRAETHAKNIIVHGVPISQVQIDSEWVMITNLTAGKHDLLVRQIKN